MQESQPIKEKQSFFLHIYDHHYKKLLIIPFVVLLLALLVLGFKYFTTGSFIDKDVSLKGGITITIPYEKVIESESLKESLLKDYPNNDIDVRVLKRAGTQVGIIINADVDGTNNEAIDAFIRSIESKLGLILNQQDYSLEFVGSTLGSSFFKEIIRTIIIAFIFMSIVVFIYFRNTVVSLCVVLAAFSDIIETFALVSLLGMKLNSAGIAAFLMLIGYSVDIDILLSNKVLRSKEGSILDRIMGAMKTGMTMIVITMAVSLVVMIFTHSDIIRQIMIIIFVGMVFDILNTWIQNAGLLRLYLEKKKHG